MADPFKPTKRVLFLLDRIRLGRYSGTFYFTAKPKPWRSYRDLNAVYGSGIRNATEAEILHMLTFDMIEEVPTPGNHDTYDTTDEDHPRLIGRGMKLALKPLGKQMLDNAK